MFKGLHKGEGGYFKVPVEILDQCLAQLNGAELKILLYILRHTWGFENYNGPVRLTVDEIRNGRYKKGRIRMDRGTGLSSGAVSEALKSLMEKGFIICYVDNTDRGRIKRYFMLRPDEKAPKEVMAVDEKGDGMPLEKWLDVIMGQVSVQKNEGRQIQSQPRTQWDDKIDMIDRVSINPSNNIYREGAKESENVDSIKERLKAKYGLDDRDMEICLSRMRDREIKNPVKFLEKVVENYAMKEKVLNEAAKKAIVKPLNYFNCYKDQRKYNIAELEKKLLERSRKEDP